MENNEKRASEELEETEKIETTSVEPKGEDGINELEELEDIEGRIKPPHDASCCSEVEFDDKEQDECEEEEENKRSTENNHKQRYGAFEEKVQSTSEKMGDWIKENYEKGKEEVLRLTKITKIKLDIVALKKKKDERLKLLGKKAIELVREGHIDADMIEPEYSMIKDIDEEVRNKSLDIADIKKKTKEDIEKEKSSAQKAIEAKSIPMDKNDED